MKRINLKVMPVMSGSENEFAIKRAKRAGRLLRLKSLIFNEKYRLSGGVILSLVIHAVFITSYLGMSSLDVPDSPPIREISFVDMTEEVVQPQATKKPKPVDIARTSTVPEPQPVDNSATAQGKGTVAKRMGGADRIFLDMSRKQAPINLTKTEAVAPKLASGGDVIKVSPAKGLQNDRKIARPAPIKLDNNRDIVLASNTSPSGSGFSLPSSKQPEIKLTGNSSTPAASNASGITLESGPKPAPQKRMDMANMKSRQTETFISGPLANRKIINKIVPPFPRWAKTKGVGATIALRFTVMEDGSIRENVLVERTSGSREWDRLVIAALKKWQFAALETNGARKDQTGVITFQFVI